MLKTRDEQFGRLLAIANILNHKIHGDGGTTSNFKYLTRFQKSPMETFAKIHEEIMQNHHKFDETYIVLFDMFSELLSEMNFEEFDDKPLNDKYLFYYYRQRDSLNNIMGVDEASKIWGLSAGTIKNYCAEGKIKAKKIGNTWVIDKAQNNPSSL